MTHLVKYFISNNHSKKQNVLGCLALIGINHKIKKWIIKKISLRPKTL